MNLSHLKIKIVIIALKHLISQERPTRYQILCFNNTKDQDWVEIGRRTDEVNAAFEAKGLSLGFLKDGKVQGG